MTLLPASRTRLPRGTRYRLEVEVMALGAAYLVFEREDGERLYLERDER